MRYTLTNHLQFLKRMRERKRENETKNTQQLIIKLKCFGRLTNLFVEKASKCEEWTTEKMQDEYWSDCGFVSMLQWWQMDGRLDGKWSCLDTNKGIILSSAYKFQAPTWFVLHGFWFTIFRSKPRSFFPFFFCQLIISCSSLSLLNLFSLIVDKLFISSMNLFDVIFWLDLMVYAVQWWPCRWQKKSNYMLMMTEMDH